MTAIPAVIDRSPAVAATPYPRVLPALTSMRFFAAAWVVAMHYCWWLPTGGSDVPVLSQGGMAVDFFFILSGFVLAHAHLDAVLKQRLGVREFLVRRLARIYPMHAVTIAFYAAMVVAAALLAVPLPNPERYGAWQLLLNVTLLHALQAHDAGAWNYPSWSISAEWIAYLAFPVLAGAMLARRGARGGRAAAACLLVAAAWAVSPLLTGTGYFDLHTNFGWLRVLPEIALGIALYGWGRTTAMPVLAAPLAVPVLVGGVIVLAWAGMQLAMLVPLSLLVLSGAERARGGAGGALSSRVLIYAGEISYALYMVHLPVATMVLSGIRGGHGITPLWALPVAAIGAVALAMLCRRFVEAPGSRLIMRLSSTGRTRS